MSDGATQDDRIAAQGQDGMSLLEVTMALGLAILALLALHSTLSASVEGRKTTSDHEQARAMGRELLSRLQRIQYGNSSHATPTAAQLDEFFDADAELGTLTLAQLVTPPDQPGWTFAVAADGVLGTWRVRVTQDVDGNGVIDGARDGREDLLRLELLFNERLVFESFRAAPPGDTLLDTGAMYLGG